MRQVALEQRAGIDIPKRPGSVPAEFIYKLRELLQSLAENVVVIDITGVTSDDPRWLRIAHLGFGLGPLSVVRCLPAGDWRFVRAVCGG